jgi:predicted O-methyltransferase YrrM
MNDYLLTKLFCKPRFAKNLLSPENNTAGLYQLIKKYLSHQTEMVEIGSFAGVSSELFAMFVKKIYCIDPYVLYEEVSKKQLFLAEQEFYVVMSKYSNIIHIKKSSHDASNQFADNSLDFVYVDGAHDYNNAYMDIKLWLPKIKSGSYIGGHDHYNKNVVKAIKDNNLTVLETFAESSWIALKS